MTYLKKRNDKYKYSIVKVPNDQIITKSDNLIEDSKSPFHTLSLLRWVEDQLGMDWKDKDLSEIIYTINKAEFESIFCGFTLKRANIEIEINTYLENISGVSLYDIDICQQYVISYGNSMVTVTPNVLKKILGDWIDELKDYNEKMEKVSKIMAGQIIPLIKKVNNKFLYKFFDDIPPYFRLTEGSYEYNPEVIAGFNKYIKSAENLRDNL